MRDVSVKRSQRSAMKPFVIPWIAGLLTWFVVTLGVDLIIDSNSGTDDVGGVVAAAWAGIVLAPALTAAVAVLLLPRSARRRITGALIAGTPIIILLTVWRLLTVEPQTGYLTVLVGSAVLIAIAAAVSLVLGVLGRTQDL